jgi:hypothetical protein
VLTPLGGALSDFTDILLDDRLAIEATGALAGALAEEPGWQAIDFPEVRPGGMAGATLHDAWPGARWALDASLCLELPASPMADFVDQLPTHSRKTVRRRVNQLRRAGLEVREVAADDADRGIGELLRLHAAQWRGRGGNPHHRSSTFAGHLTQAAGAMIGSGQAALLEYRVDDRLLASSLVLTGHDLVGGYLYGADPELRDRVDVTTMLLADTLPMAYRLGCSTMSMLRGAEEHKLRWRPRESRNTRILLARPGSVRGPAYAMGVRARHRAVAVAKAKAPWLRTVRDRVRRWIR